MTDIHDPSSVSVNLSRSAEIPRNDTSADINRVSEKKPAVAKALQAASTDTIAKIDALFNRHGQTISALRIVEDETKAATYVVMLDEAVKQRNMSEVERLSRLLLRMTE